MSLGLPVFDAIERSTVKLLYPLALCFALAWLADAIGLAALVGAFAAGVIIDERHFAGEPPDGRRMEDLIAPLEVFFAPIFFVLMGLQVNLAVFLDPYALVLAAGLIVCAVVGKLVAGLAAGAGHHRLTVGIGMMPRGEVALVMANVGKALGVIDDVLFSAIVIMAIVTTLLTPVLLRRAFAASGETT